MERRVVIYRCGSLGDTVVALPALKLIARAFPNSERWLLTNFSANRKVAQMASVLEGMGLVHGYIEYPAGLRDMRRLWHLWRDIKALNARTVVYLTEPVGRLHTWRNSVFLWSCGLRRQIGVPWGRDRQRVQRIGPNMWESEGARQARCVAGLGDAGVERLAAYDLNLHSGEFSEAQRVLESLAGRDLIGLSLGTKLETKEWGNDRWGPLIDQLALRYPDYGLVMVGSTDEASRCEALCTAWRGRVLNLCGLSIRVTAAVLARCGVFVGHDSGPMHLAASVGTRCVAVFSSIHLPGKWFPCGNGHHVLYTRIRCQGCGLEKCEKYSKRCIRSISVQNVLDAVIDILG